MREGVFLVFLICAFVAMCVFVLKTSLEFRPTARDVAGSRRKWSEQAGCEAFASQTPPATVLYVVTHVTARARRAIRLELYTALRY